MRCTELLGVGVDSCPFQIWAIHTGLALESAAAYRAPDRLIPLVISALAKAHLR